MYLRIKQCHERAFCPDCEKGAARLTLPVARAALAWLALRRNALSQEHVAFVGVQLLWLFTGVLLVLTIKVYRVRVRSTVGLILVGLLLGFLLTSLYGDPHITEVRGPDFYRIALGIAIAFNSLIVIAMRWTHGSRRTTGGGLVTFLAILSLLFDLYTLMGIGTGSFLIRQ